MKKLLSLIKTIMAQDMNIFVVKKNQSKFSKKILPIALYFLIFIVFISYADEIIKVLAPIHLEYILLSLFIFLTFILTVMEGIYKASGLLFKCKDDDLLLSLPIKKSTILFIRILKFYIFELLYNSMFLVPAIVVYAYYLHPTLIYYLISIIFVLLLPIIPIIISVIIGIITTYISSRFKAKNIIQMILTTIIFVLIFYISFNSENIMNNFLEKASSINDLITKIYYPAGLYINLITNFNIKDLIIFIIINILLVILTIKVLNKLYFKINSNIKVTVSNKNHSYKIKVHSQIMAIVKKEFTKFISTPVFVTNTIFGLVLFIISCVLISINASKLLSNLEIGLTFDMIKNYMPIVLLGLITFASLMSSITCSMISLEGNTFNLLKSLPIKSNKIILGKILMAIFIMIPIIIIGDIIVFSSFNFNILEIILCLLFSCIAPFVSATIGIIVNLKYPKMNFINDTEVIKQSSSSMIAVLIGMFGSVLTIYLLYKLISLNLTTILIMLICLLIYILIAVLLFIYLNTIGIKDFKKINV